MKDISALMLGFRGRVILFTLSTAWVAGGFTAGALAQTAAYPSKPIKLVVGYPPGGASDLAARIIGQKLSERFSQAVVVENRSGSAGNIGAEAVVKSSPDG